MIGFLRQLLAAILFFTVGIPIDAYDAVWNRTQKMSTLPGYPGGLSNYNANDRLGTDTYDADGNTTASNGLGYAYDFENHLVQQAGLTIVYDGDGNRVSKTTASGTTKFLVDDRNPTGYAQVMDDVQSGTVSRTYSWGLELIDQSRPQPSPNPALVTYYVFDGHGSVRALTNRSGAVTDTYDYDAFGNLLHSTGTTPNNYLFAGEQYDPDLNLYYNRARYLTTNTGRFLTADSDEGDPESPTSLHKYTYGWNDPVNHVDRTGHGIEDALTAAYIAVTNFAASYPIFTTTLAYVTAGLNIYLFTTDEDYRAAYVALGPAAAVETLAADVRLITTTPAALFRNLKTVGVAADGLAQLAALRSDLGLQRAVEGQRPTLAKLQIADTNFFGISAHGQDVTLTVNPISAAHAEADVFQQASLAKVKADEATLYVDHELCLACGRNGAVQSMARQIGLKRLIVVTPNGSVIWDLLGP
jgi:RHS repeat-associated protein